ncbi:TRAP transporter small permease [Maritimibacter sp. UBA3975]|uniref:TRAP transporter small permease n=1 Tax=Maritimibacter sp. UBA3975 TaxID=1946833 RepID=UPI000C0A76D1|nr:TRAP transporter small permease [Maritimibacter sp. UBA3975]MAM63589.1 TRAP transporter permease DctQ [Maritimibacter sp.]|tara:strand:+ start:17656 stop:18306 length:651 start_codon:yes stop_codon:yes gene_type:complete
MSAPGHRRGFEETAIAVILGLMTIVTFVNVVLRYGFNESLIWGLEVTLILFAWLVLLGVSYGVRVTMHLGVDAITGLLSTRPRRVLALISAAICLAYAFLLFKGAWDYWAPYAGLWQTEGRWFPVGFDTGTRDRAFFVTDQVPMPGFLKFLEDWINFGEEYDKLPRVIPYAMLPIGTGLLLFRFIQATVRIVRGKSESLIVSHEMEDDVAAARVED